MDCPDEPGNDDGGWVRVGNGLWVTWYGVWEIRSLPGGWRGDDGEPSTNVITRLVRVIQRWAESGGMDCPDVNRAMTMGYRFGLETACG